MQPIRSDSTDAGVRLPVDGRAAAAPRATDASSGQCLELVQGLDAVIWELDARTSRFTFVSDRAEHLFGYPLRRWYDEPTFWQDVLVHPDDCVRWVAFRAAATREVRDRELVYRARTAGGRMLWLKDLVRVAPDAAGAAAFARGATVDVTREHETGRGQERVRAALGAGHMGTWEWDFERDKVSWSPEVERMLGVPDGTLWDTFEAYHALVHRDDRDAARDAIEDALGRRAEAYHSLHRVVRSDGGVRWIDAHGRFDYAQDGRPLRLVGVCADVTERRLMEEAKAEELARLAAAVQRSNREIEQLAHIAAHDLRAPLRGIANLAQWLEDDLGDALTDGARRHLRLLHERVRRMTAVVDGIRAYSRTAGVRGECAVVDTGQVVREAVELLAPPPEVHIEIAGALPTITTERGPLLQVMLNLLSNAIEHGRTDAPRITVGARDADGEIEFSVSDNGPGIPPELHDSIWRIFQAPEPVEPATATGVGLAVVKKIVEARGGRAWVESTPGHGATFRFTWAKGRAGRA